MPCHVTLCSWYGILCRAPASTFFCVIFCRGMAWHGMLVKLSCSVHIMPLISFHDVCHVICHVVFCSKVLYHVIYCHTVVVPRHASSWHVKLCCIFHFHVEPQDARSNHIMTCLVKSCHVFMPRYVLRTSLLSHQVVPCNAISLHVCSCFNVSCKIVTCFTLPFHHVVSDWVI